MLGKYETIDQEIIEFRKHIEKYEFVLNTEAVWLFLATLGCWGVSNPFVKLAAFAITAFLFGKRIISRIGDARSLREIADVIESKINDSELEPDTKKARLFDLELIRKAQFSVKLKRRDLNSFIVCWVFFAVSIGFAMYSLPSPQ
ncbi:hypothetical protein AB2373_17020 [Vibrio cholerae]|uniref:hypothetical protein n=1 Tax=Vibrio cholerae TaxID=666 RepID=UPI003F9A31AE